MIILHICGVFDKMIVLLIDGFWNIDIGAINVGECKYSCFSFEFSDFLYFERIEIMSIDEKWMLEVV